MNFERLDGEYALSEARSLLISETISKTCVSATSFLINSGTYIIKVYNNDNIGNYSLAVGEAEFFGSNTFEKILTWTPIIFYIGPYMDMVHWKKFDVAAYIPHIVLLVLFFLVYIIVKKLFFRKKNYLE